ncbi:hypothetical protein K2173_006142 [Erythroxylum novogranatense]|uniref:Uncharacterized protein n=1 Tax=Erythroxylum novogranatense TaxID=1862640 RepID=A0AAV8TCF8_9ROSI|nr:hypothetical protein K2173_006142 [Erythroxylum novogranatense]
MPTTLKGENGDDLEATSSPSTSSTAEGKEAAKQFTSNGGKLLLSVKHEEEKYG